jgi:D-aspartate ligase
VTRVPDGSGGAVGSAPGGLVVGGDYRALGVVRSLGRRGIPVWVLRSPEDHRLAALSRYCRRRIVWPDGPDERRLRFLLDLAEQYDLADWVLFPTADATAAFVARQHAALRDTFRLTTPTWDQYRWAYDKRCTAELAATLGIETPRTRAVCTRSDAERYDGEYPVLLKPATKPRLNRPAVKAWPADDHAELLVRFDEASALTEPGTLMIQELIPGAEGAQMSFAALCEAGRPIASVTAERVRQYPPDFGRSSTFVVTVDNPVVEDLGRRVLAALALTGLAEVEFKRDNRSNLYKLLDINVRVWGWHTIARRAGLDFPYLAWRLALGRPVTTFRAPAGLRWLRLTTDLAAGVPEVVRRQLPAGGYLRSIADRHERAVLAGDDPVPGLLELPLFLASHLRPGHRSG